jgi:hypothetical protein
MKAKTPYMIDDDERALIYTSLEGMLKGIAIVNAVPALHDLRRDAPDEKKVRRLWKRFSPNRKRGWPAGKPAPSTKARELAAAARRRR